MERKMVAMHFICLIRYEASNLNLCIALFLLLFDFIFSYRVTPQWKDRQQLIQLVMNCMTVVLTVWAHHRYLLFLRETNTIPNISYRISCCRRITSLHLATKIIFSNLLAAAKIAVKCPIVQYHKPPELR